MIKDREMIQDMYEAAKKAGVLTREHASFIADTVNSKHDL
jgi:hypothetical protein